MDSSDKRDARPSLRALFAAFLRLGATAFGGPSMVAYMRIMAVERKRWLDDVSFHDGVALCQMIPGATAMQTAAYIGLRARGVLGAIAAFIGFGLPAFLMMMAVSALYTRTHDLPLVVSAFSGLQAVIVAVVANATVSFGRTSLRTAGHVVIAGAAAIMFACHINPIVVVVAAGVLGLVFVRNASQASATSPAPIPPVRATTTLLILLSIVVAGLALLFFSSRALFEVALLMVRIDLFAFGGGFASVPLMFHEIVEVRQWMDGPTFVNGIVLGQITPGPIVITATFVGYLIQGPLGGLVATIGIFSPSFLVLVGTVPYFDRLRTSPRFMRIIAGILCSFVGLLLTVTFRFGANVHWDIPHVMLASAALAALLAKIDILWIVIAGTAISATILA